MLIYRTHSCRKEIKINLLLILFKQSNNKSANKVNHKITKANLKMKVVMLVIH